MGQPFEVSRRAVLAGSTVSALALTLPAGALGQADPRFRALVTLSWGPGEGEPGRRRQLIAAITAALAESGADMRATWVLANA